MTPPPDPLDAVAQAVAEFREITRSGGTADPFAWRERLGPSHADFLELVEMESALDRLLEPPLDEPLPRDFGAYRLLQELGRGAAGVVYAAEHRGSGRRAAVKILKTGFASDATARERFRRETLACARVRHDHVVEIYESGEVNHHPYYAMALVPGRSLSSLLATGEAPPPKELARQLAAIADALHALHEAGVVHRDVKPSNLIVRDDGHFFLADFGLARGGEGLALTGTGEALGTPLYMSPEQLLGQRGGVDGRTDVYALGATLYEALAGHPVFQASDLSGLVGQVLTARPEPIGKLAPATGAGLERVALKALEKRKEDRYPTAAALRDDLLAYAEERPVVGRPIGLAVRGLRVVRARALVIAAAVLVASGGFYLWTQRSAELTVDTLPPGATVLVGGVEVGHTPLRLEVAPGACDVVMRHPRYLELVEPCRMAAGGTHVLRLSLIPIDTNDPETHREMEASRGLEPVPLVRPSPPHRGTRGLDDAVVSFLSPRGAVSLDEVDDLAFELDVPEAFQDDGRIEFRRGSEVLGTIAAFNPTKTWGSVPVPKGVRDALRVGDAVTIEWMPPVAGSKTVRPSVASFHVIAPPDRAARERLVADLQGLPDDLDLELHAGWLRSQGRALAAARLADPIADEHLTSVRAQAVAYAAYVDLGLAESRRAKALVERLEAFQKAASVPVLLRAVSVEDRLEQIGK